MSYFKKVSKTDISPYIEKMQEQCKVCKIDNNENIFTCPNYWLTDHMKMAYNKMDNDGKFMFLQLVNKDGCVLFSRNENIIKQKRRKR